MIDWTTVLIAIFSSGGIATVLVKYMELRNCKKTKLDATQHARDIVLISISAEILIARMESCIKKGYMDMHDRRFCQKLHDAYKILGGNDIVDALYDQCLELPPTPCKQK